MAKHILRIIVTVILVGALGFTAWTYFYKPGDDEVVYAELTKLTNKVASEAGVLTTFTELSNETHFGKGDGKVLLSPGSNPEIFTTRMLLFGTNSILTFESFYPSVLSGYENLSLYNQISYTYAIEQLNTILKSYASISQFSEGAKALNYDNVLDAIKVLNAKHSALQDSIKVTINFQTNNALPNDSIQRNTLRQYYINIVNNYYDYLFNYTILLDEISAYNTKFVYNNNFIYDTQNIFYEGILSNLKKFTTLSGSYSDVKNYGVTYNTSTSVTTLNAATLEKNSYLYDAFVINKSYNFVSTNKSDENEAANYAALVAFNLLKSDYNVVLFGTNSFLNKSNAKKVAIANQTDAAEVALINVNYLPSVLTLLNYYGFLVVE